MKNEIERRYIPRSAGEVRFERREGGKTGIAGTAAVVDSLSEELFGFREKIAPGAFDSALKKSDIRGLFNHDPNMILGRTKPGTMTVRADGKGLHYDIPDLPASRADVAEAIERGDVDGNSFSFVVGKDSWEYPKEGPSIRTILEFDELFDLGPVTFPAYPQTTVSARARAMATAKPAESLVDASAASDARRRALDLMAIE